MATPLTGQRPHSEIPTCIILYNFTPFIRPLKPVMFIFPLLIFLTLIQVSIFFKIISAFRMLVKEQLFRSAAIVI